MSRDRIGTRVLALAAIVTLVFAGCGSQLTSPTSPVLPATTAGSGLTLQGDPESATWTFTGSAAGASVDLQGILLKPRGAGPFPAVIISHGAGGNANGYSRSIAADMVTWGLVCIATNYTHATGVPLGSPGSANDPGASAANVTRARAAYEILRSLGYVDMTRVAAHGHSMGAFVTTALLASVPDAFRVASHTAGGVRPDSGSGAAPTESQARSVRTPYQLHHGDQDTTVALAMDQRLADVLQGVATDRELFVYSGVDHNGVSRDPTVLNPFASGTPPTACDASTRFR
jgi:dienelactone hydrolase